MITELDLVSKYMPHPQDFSSSGPCDVMTLVELVIWDFCYVDLLLIWWAGRLNYCFYHLTLSLGQNYTSCCLAAWLPFSLGWGYIPAWLTLVLAMWSALRLGRSDCKARSWVLRSMASFCQLPWVSIHLHKKKMPWGAVAPLAWVLEWRHVRQTGTQLETWSVA